MAHSSAKSLLALAARRSPEERLLPGRERSDTWPTEAGDGAGVFAVRMERLLPSAHGVFVEVAPTSTVGELKVQYLAALARETGGRGTSADVEAGRILALADSLELRLILDGAELRDEALPLPTAGVGPGDCVIVLVRRRRRCLFAAAERLCRWWPLLLSLGLAAGAIATLARALAGRACGASLLGLAVAGVAALLPYGLVLSGMTNDECGRRLFWPLRMPRPLATRACAAMLAASLLACALLSARLWSEDGVACKRLAPDAYYVSFAVWLLLSLANAPWGLLLLLPCLLACRSPLAFEIVAHLSGANGGSMQR
uniref:Ubiquitin-like domain-containing protein n=1 Tax=Emiliania huxleyi TaxID=2903 RepID=A0A6V2MC83_EMIHU|mmetsp:Transcript_31348/g.103417  ORF Transcript_31348/g.103417 Transcript_31348/m.103417 type:complete len:314 (+) Transcript_31348:43-984(+)